MWKNVYRKNMLWALDVGWTYWYDWQKLNSIRECDWKPKFSFNLSQDSNWKIIRKIIEYFDVKEIT